MRVASYGRTIMRRLSGSVALCLSASTALAAEPVGQYKVDGNNPGHGSPYDGSVAVKKNGQTYRVICVAGDTRYIGAGIGQATSSRYPTAQATTPPWRCKAPTATTGKAYGPTPSATR